MLREIGDTVGRGGFVALSVAFAIAFATYYVADALAQVVVVVLSQHVHRHEPSPFGNLSFTIGDTAIDYGVMLHRGLALALVGGALYALVRRDRNVLRECPDCLSEIPAEASVCRYCTCDLSQATW